MNLIIAEKNLSAARIAQILAGRERVAQKMDGPISVYTFGDTAVVGLKGHVVEVDFVEGYADWRSEERTPRSLIEAPTTKVPTEKKIISTIQRLAKQASRVIIATDFDTEGELIGKETFDLVRQVNRTVPILRAHAADFTSIHTCSWPAPEPELESDDAEALGDQLVVIASAVRRNKSEHNLPLGGELKVLQLAPQEPDMVEQLNQAIPDLSSVCRAIRIDIGSHINPRFIQLPVDGSLQIAIEV